MLLPLLAATLASPILPPTDHGRLPWFEGTYEAALEKAATENKLVFIDFWTEW